MEKLVHLLRCRWRAIGALLIGIVADRLAHHLGGRPATSALVGWDSAALWFVLTTYHALLSFLFNTMVLALGINIIASLIS